MPFPIGGPLKPNLYLQPFSRYSTPTHVPHTYQQTRRIAIPPDRGNKKPVDSKEHVLYKGWTAVNSKPPAWDIQYTFNCQI